MCVGPLCPEEAPANLLPPQSKHKPRPSWGGRRFLPTQSTADPAIWATEIGNLMLCVDVEKRCQELVERLRSGSTTANPGDGEKPALSLKKVQGGCTVHMGLALLTRPPDSCKLGEAQLIHYGSFMCEELVPKKDCRGLTKAKPGFGTITVGTHPPTYPRWPCPRAWMR